MMNEYQATYALRKATRDTLEQEVERIERDYIAAHGIMNQDGVVPEKSWMIDDDAVFERMMAEIGEQLNEVGAAEASIKLREAEDELIRYGLSVMPAVMQHERQVLEDLCFGLNGHYVHLDTRQKVIDLTFRLDTRTVKLSAVKGATCGQ